MFATALVVSLYIGLYKTWWGYTLGCGPLGIPLCVGLVTGMAMGKVEEALIMSTGIQAIYLGLVSPGGNIATDSAMASAVAIPVALSTGMDTNQAITLAVPIGLISAVMNQLRYIICGIFARNGDKCAETGDTKNLMLNATVYPSIVAFVLYAPITFIAVYYGISAIEVIFNAIPSFILRGLTVAGGILPALGFGLIIMVIGQKKLIPFFIIGFFMVQYFNMSTIGVAVFAVCTALLIVLMGGGETSTEGVSLDDGEREHILTTSDVNNMFFRWWLTAEVNHSYERMQSLAYCWAMVPSLKKLYPEHEDFCEGMKRHMAYFNTQGIWGAVIHGVALSMEEENAISKAMTYEEADAAINGIKTGFMGPLAGIGDTFDWGTLYYLFIGLGMTFTEKGQWIGVVIAVVPFTIVTYVEGLLFTNLGYRLGRNSVAALFAGGMVDKLILASGIIGMMMMGALGSAYVSFSFASEGLQGFMDSLAPNVMCLIIIFAVYLIMTKVTQKVAWISAGMIIVSILLALVGIC